MEIKSQVCEPFQVIERVGPIAYKLLLPATAKIHLGFHVSVLKKKVDLVTTVIATLLEFDGEGKVILKSIKILARRLVKQGDSLTNQILVQWAHIPEGEVI